jgi:transcription-repair coupling factor (superfamily II helicase)
MVMIDSFENIQVTADEIEEQAVKFRRESINEGLLADDFPIPYTSWSELQDQISGMGYLELGSFSIEEKSDIAGLFKPGQRFAGRLKHFIDHVSDIYADGEDIFIISRQVSRLKELWKGRRKISKNNNRLTFVDGTLSDGWILSLPDGGRLNLITDSEIFGWERPKPRQRRRPEVDAPEKDYADLIVHDWVVHIDYGIGRYEGLVKRTVEEVEREFLLIEYEAGDQLYVPIHQADRLSRYIGTTSNPPKMTRLGTGQWKRAKSRVRESVHEIALDLMDLYAKRQNATGYSFSPDTTWQKDLESAFPYIETEDQLNAIEEIKRDMESTRPMDRLLCGDVGYGKTEVALRAAFKAVLEGKQVGILVPTTVLAQQHFDTFRHRLAPYPVEVEMLSRFRTNKQQNIILRRLLAGTVDIVIGTHRLVQSDVQFKDLGLVIIDEEQRFGVTHKEYLKKLRTEVDVLTMTATPIPRTLYMALTGVRDISTINTPPEERLPIITHIGPYSPRLTRQAILRELERGGQTFFVHNRVRTIRAMESHLNKLVPEVRIGVGHGQMPEKELSSVMKHFTSGEIDLLLCTSIIESGLDIPNANTLIVDRGDTFGLAQLYQLRGRVGRGAQRAYAYFFRHRLKAPTLEGLERLETIAENTQLGAGYSIAMRDLEMRGAGELLGTQQHGYIASVGFHLYTSLLAQAVNQTRIDQGEQALSGLDSEIPQTSLAIPVNVDLPISVGIPVFYIPDDFLRLQLYRRLANLRNSTEIESIRDEFVDRFGPIPEEVENLFYKIRVKLLAELAGLASVTKEGDQIVLKFGYQTRIGKNAYRLLLNEHGDWHKRLLSVLSTIIDLCHRNN